jgi:hypothetical protein
MDSPSHTPLASNAKQAFWASLQEGRYADLPEVSESLTAAYLANPRDSELALLAAHAHLWQLSERSRRGTPKASITDQAVLAVHYFEQASRMRPDDGRILGWLGGSQTALGAINDDERLRRQGYFTLLDAVDSYPEFNHFTMNYAMSSIAADHERWPEVMNNMWESVDVCAGERVSREVPDYSPYATLAVEQRDLTNARRVCWTVPAAPHNFEGFFLHNGDVLVKDGQPDVAIRMYENAKLSRTYASWPYRDVLETRIATAEARAKRFEHDGQGEMMISSNLACTGCHQR